MMEQGGSHHRRTLVGPSPRTLLFLSTNDLCLPLAKWLPRS